MAIQFQCGSCGKAHQAKDELAGKTVKCPACSQPVQVPAAAGGQLAVQCPGCGAGYRLGAQLAGKVVKCKQCGGQIVVGGGPQPAMAGAARQQAAAPAFGSIADLLDDAGPGKIIAPPKILPGQTLCPNCHEPIPMGAALCTHCGFDFRAGKAIATRIERPRTEAEQARVDSLKAAVIVIFAPFVILIPGAIVFVCWVFFDLGHVTGVPGFALKSFALFLGVIGGALTVLGYFSLLADALQEGWLQALLFFIVPFYILYFVATRWQKCRRTYINMWIAYSMFIGGLPGTIERFVEESAEEEPSNRRYREFSRGDVLPPATRSPEGNSFAGWTSERSGASRRWEDSPGERA